MAFHGKRILMLESLKLLLDRLVEGQISIPEIIGKISDKAAVLREMWNSANEFIAPYVPAFVVALLLVGLSLCEAVAGKRLLGFQKFVLCFALGFVVGTVYIQPLVAPHVANYFVLDATLTGVIVGITAGLLCRPIYFCGYIGIIGYFAYFLMMNGVLLDFTKGSKTIGIIVAAVLIIVALVFRKIVEIVGTSLLGAIFTYKAVDYAVSTFASGASMVDLLGQNEIYVKIAIIAFVALTGTIFQYQTRRRW